MEWTTLLWSTPEHSQASTDRYIRRCKLGTLRYRTPTLQSTLECSIPYPGFANVDGRKIDNISLYNAKILSHPTDSPLYQPHTEHAQDFSYAYYRVQTMLKSDYLAILATLVLTAFIYIRIRKRSRLPLPPGPKKLPLLGNLFDLPTSHEWLTYAKLCKQYSMYRGL